MLFMVFDVESVGLFGEGFAVGHVIIDTETKQTLSMACFACNHLLAQGNADGHDWVEANVICSLNCNTPQEVRQQFWLQYMYWKQKGAILAADCPWPVEARFLTSIFEAEKAPGPYPLIDIASVRLAAGLDPLGIESRLTDELPVHNPLADARQSARLLLEALEKGLNLITKGVTS